MGDFLESIFVGLAAIFVGIWTLCFALIILAVFSAPIWITALVIWLVVR